MGGGSNPTQLLNPSGIAIDSSVAYVIADSGNHRIQRCPFASPGSACFTVAGTGGPGSNPTQLLNPSGIVIDLSGDYAISDSSNNRIQRCPAASPGSACTTVAGTGDSSSTQLGSPFGIAIIADSSPTNRNQDESSVFLMVIGIVLAVVGVCTVAVACFAGAKFFTRPRSNPAPTSKTADCDVEAGLGSNVPRPATGTLLGTPSTDVSKKDVAVDVVSI